jgi:hypothetical protein
MPFAVGTVVSETRSDDDDQDDEVLPQDERPTHGCSVFGGGLSDGECDLYPTHLNSHVLSPLPLAARVSGETAQMPPHTRDLGTGNVTEVSGRGICAQGSMIITVAVEGSLLPRTAHHFLMQIGKSIGGISHFCTPD